MFLVDASGRIVHCNLSGHDMLGEADILYSQQDILTAADPQAGQSLRNEIAAVSTGDTATGAVAVALSSSPDQHWLAHVLPLTSGARRSSMQAIAKIYKLTPSELRVFAAVVDVGGILAVADALGISEATVKTHLQHVFEKTGQRRQTDLMKLLANHANPLRA